MTYNVLENYKSFMVYLAGPIDFAPDLGVSYRQKLHTLLGEAGLEDNMILDPTKKPLGDMDAYKVFDRSSKRCNMNRIPAAANPSL